MSLQRIGYWDDGRANWPNPRDLEDESWSDFERESVASYLQCGFVARAYMGYAKCRLCGIRLGDMDLTDGVYVWPQGLDHYLLSHKVRLPDWFVRHVLDRQDFYEGEDFVDDQWAKSTSSIGS